MKKALIADDSVTIHKLMTCFLSDYKDEEFTIFKAQDGAAALFKLEKDAMDIIFLDLNMPIVDGFSVVEFINDRKLKAQIVIISSTLDKDIVVKLGKLGVKHFLPKPITSDKIETLLKKIY